MARRRFQSPKPFKEGQYWWLRVWDTNLTGSRKRQRLKLAPADMPVREVQKIAEQKLHPVNQGLVLTGSAMNFGDFVTNIYDKTYLPLLSRSTQDCYTGVILKYLKPEFRAGISPRPYPAHGTTIFLRHGRHDALPNNLENQGHDVLHPPFCGRCGLPNQKPAGRVALAVG